MKRIKGKREKKNDFACSVVSRKVLNRCEFNDGKIWCSHKIVFERSHRKD